MTDTPTSRYGARQMSLGSRTNTWGDDSLNEMMRLFDRGSKGYQAYTVTGDATLTWTNYVATNDGQVATLKLTGSPTGAFTLTLPSKEWELNVWNATSYAATIKCSGGTGVTIPASRKVRLFSDGSDVGDSTPNYLPTATTLTNNQDLVSKLQLETAIATASVPASAGTVLVSAADTTAGYAGSKNTALTNGGLVRSTLNSGANEKNQFGLDFTNLTVTTNTGASDRFALYDATATAMRYQTRANVVGKRGLILQSAQTSGFPAAAGNAYPVDVSSATFTVTLPASATVGDCIDLYIGGTYGVTLAPNGLKLNGSTSNIFLQGEQTLSITYHSSGRGWV